MFLVDIFFPSELALGNEDQKLVNILCKSAALPGSNVGVIEVPFRGRTVKIAGDRTFDTWSVTFFNDKDFKSRAFFEQWMDNINSHEANTAPLFRPQSSAGGYMANLEVKQLEKTGEISMAKSSELISYGTASQLLLVRLILLMIATIRLRSLLLNSKCPTGLQMVMGPVMDPAASPLEKRQLNR